MKTLAQIFAERGDAWNARNPQEHAGRAFRPRSNFHGGGREPHDEVDGYDRPTHGPRAVVRKREFVEEQGRKLDPEPRLRAIRIMKALKKC